MDFIINFDNIFAYKDHSTKKELKINNQRTNI